jgi:hypothetical protein
MADGGQAPAPMAYAAHTTVRNSELALRVIAYVMSASP